MINCSDGDEEHDPGQTEREHDMYDRLDETVVPGHGDLDILLVILYRRVKVPSVRSIIYSTT